MSRGERPRDRRMTSLMMLMSVYLLVSPVDVDAGMCSSSDCLNGGQMIMPNSVFGYCRCRCPENFSGPKCQFVSKRVADVAPRLVVDKGSTGIINGGSTSIITGSTNIINGGSVGIINGGSTGIINGGHINEHVVTQPSLQEIINRLHGKHPLGDSLKNFHVD